MKNIQLTESQLKRLRKNLIEQEENTQSDDLNMSMLGSRLLHSQTQSHVFHLQTESYAEHKALQAYYEGIDALLDSLIEAYQGKNDIVSNYDTFPMVPYSGKEDVIAFFEELLNTVKEITKDYPSFLRNIVDDIEVLITSTLYKLKKLS